MATLSPAERVDVRNRLEAKALALGIPVSWVKGLVDAAAQAVEDLISGDSLIARAEVPAGGISFPVLLSARLDAATQPFGVTLTAAQKRHLVAFVLRVKFERDQ